MSDEYSIHTNFQRASDDPRAEREYEHRMRRLAETADENVYTPGEVRDLEGAPRITVRCVKCGSGAILFPRVRALPGHALDPSRVLVACDDCGHEQTVAEATEIGEG